MFAATEAGETEMRGSMIQTKTIEAFEDEFGRIETGLFSSADSDVQIVKYKGDSSSRLAFVGTLGLADKSRKKGGVGCEWFMEFPDDLSANQAASVLDHYVSMYLSGEIPEPKRGSYILFSSLKDRVWPNDNSVGFYFTIPVFRSDEFRKKSHANNIVPIWVVPIIKQESEILESHGWHRLEEYWDHMNTDLHDAYRVQVL